jgi:hypothetical protein
MQVRILMRRSCRLFLEQPYHGFFNQYFTSLLLPVPVIGERRLNHPRERRRVEHTE